MGVKQQQSDSHELFLRPLANKTYGGILQANNRASMPTTRSIHSINQSILPSLHLHADQVELQTSRHSSAPDQGRSATG